MSNEWIKNAADTICDGLAQGTRDAMKRVGFEPGEEKQFMEMMEENKKTVENVIKIAMREACVSVWVSVDERLPENARNVLVHCFDGDVFIDHYLDTEHGWFFHEEVVTHWMELPVGPKEN